MKFSKPLQADIGISFAMTSFIVASLVVLCLGCGRDATDPRGKRVAVRGQVTLDGKPLNRARIIFRPANGDASVTATGSIVDGEFTIPAKHGSLIGMMRVEIHADTIELAEFETRKKSSFRNAAAFQTVRIPAKYNRRSKLTAEVFEDEEQNAYDFPLTTK